MKTFKKIDYKGKHFILQDEIMDDMYDYEIGEMNEKEITDDFLKDHVQDCNYYGIPAYVGEDKNLIQAIKEIEEKMIENQ